MEWCVEIRVISFVVCFCFISITLLLSGFDANEEGDALIKFKDGLTDPSNVLSNWDNSLITPCGTWSHISCGDHNEGDKVTRIDLGNQQLSGSLSPELGKLKHLEYLELYNNTLTGSIPPEFGEITNLKSLDLYDNMLTGSIPRELGNLEKLTFLRLHNNNLSGRVPVEALAQHRSIQVVSFYPGNPCLCNPFKSYCNSSDNLPCGI